MVEFPRELLRRQLSDGLNAMGLGVAVDADALDALLQYLAELQRWNRSHNLTAIRDPQEMVTHHLLDSLALLPYTPEGRLLDVGSGAGLPGVPLAIVRPAQDIVLIEPHAKKVAFLRHLRSHLGLARVEVHAGRVESYRPAEPIAAILSRATASLAGLDALTQHLQGSGTQVLAAKGPGWIAELQEWPRATELAPEIIPLTVPGLPPRFLVRWPKPRLSTDSTG
ncbi:MAG: 16S rRNA (guanine(527)-N(7))-methyltransferase RsmG [Acidithiobacillus sp.]